MIVSFKLKRPTKTCWEGETYNGYGFEGFRERERERERDSSLKYWAIRPSKFFGARRKVVLCREAYAWTPFLESFVKLREVGDLSYLGFTLCLSDI